MFSPYDQKKLRAALNVALCEADIWLMGNAYDYTNEADELMQWLIETPNTSFNHINQLVACALSLPIGENQLESLVKSKTRAVKDLVKTIHWLVNNISKWDL